MIDVVDSDKRSRMMAGIRGSNTKPEVQVRRFLHRCGFRFRLQRRDLSGKPDLVLPKHHLAIFVHGCFWHRHPGCRYATTPATRQAFWEEKLNGNAARDRRNVQNLLEGGWRVLVIWECGLKHHFEELDVLPNLILNASSYIEWPQVPPRSASS